MNNAPQILDFLLGNINTESKTSAPIDKGVSNDLFAQLFGEQLALGDALPGIAKEATGLNEITSQGNSSILSGMSITPDDAAIDVPLEGMASESQILTALNTSDNGLPVMGLPLTEAAAQFALNETIGENIELVSGKYEIKGAEIKEGQLELTLSGKDGSDNQPLIKLTLNAEAASKMFKNMAAGNSDSGRTALNGVDEQINHLKSVLADIDLKELTVELDENSEIQKPAGFNSGDAATKITLVAESSGQAYSIQSKLNRSDYSAKKSGKLPVAEPILSSDGSYLQNLNGVKAGLMSLTRPTMYTGQTGQTDQMFNELLNATGETQFIGNEFITDDATSDLVAIKQDLSNDSGLALKPTVLNRPANLVFAKDSFMNLRPDGQSITLKIDPEHLGSARLRLVLHENNLVARIVVDNVQAKEMLERNIDRLVDQLSKADISVESIEVNVGGEDRNQSSFDQMAFWQQRNKIAMRQAGAKSLTQAVEPASVGYQRPAGYLNRDSVNLLA